MYPNYPQQPSYPSYPNQPNFGFNPDAGSGFSNYPPPQPSYPTQGYPSYPTPNYDTGYPGSSNYAQTYDNYNSHNQNNTGFSSYLPPPGPSLNNYQPNTPNFGYDNYNSFNNPQPSYNDSYNPTPTPPFFNNYDTSSSNGSIYPNLSNFNNPPASNTFYPGQISNTFFEGTVKPAAPFNPYQDAERLYRAMKGFGTDEATLIDVLCKRTYAQRAEIANCYKASFGKDLLKNLKDETSGKFELLLTSLMQSPAELEANHLKEAIQGLGTKEDTVIDIFCTKNNSEMYQLKEKYRLMYKRDMIQDVADDTSGYFKRLLVSLGAASRSTNPPDYGRASQQANELLAAGVKRLGTDEITFNRIFASESFEHLKLVFDEYKKRAGHDIEHAIKNEMSGDVERAFMALVEFTKNPASYYARRLHESMVGFGTRDRTLIRWVVLRSELDMVQVKQEFQRKYNKTLESFIKGDTSGDYKRALLCLIADPNWK